MRRANSLLIKWIFAAAVVCVTPLFIVKASPPNQRPRQKPAINHRIPEPSEVIGFRPGDDRKLASWAQIVDYFKRLEQTSNRLKFQELGKTTLGRPFILATISSPSNLARLEHFKDIQRKLADPRTFNGSDTEAEKLIAEGRTIVLITCGIHSTEVGGNLVSMNIAHKLVSDSSPETLEILDRCIVLLVPSLNPDGVDIVKSWYDKTLGTPAEGASPPELYHHYTGHDNNRDWYAFTQVETQLTIDKVHNVWHPQIVHDIHQQGENGSRFFLPPYVEPWEPNVPPIIQAGVNFMGSTMAWELVAEGKAGVVTNGVYDAWTPARSYQHYHGGIRILSETASARIASPTNIPFEQLTPQIGVNPKLRSANFPLVWQGGEWKLANIVDYMQSGAFALMRNAARYRERWLRDFYKVGKDAVRERKSGAPFAFLIPPVNDGNFWRVEGRRRLLAILSRGEVEMIDAPSAFEAGGKNYPGGTTIVPMAQPYGAFAKTLLERQHYPDIREYPGGPPRRPYDVTAHTLPLLMGVDAIQVDSSFSLPAPRRMLSTRGEPAINQRTVRVGLYKSSAASMDEGWTRWTFDQYKKESTGFDLRYEPLKDADLVAVNLELKLVAKGTEIPYQTKEAATAAAKSVSPGGDQYTSEWVVAPYLEQPADHSIQVGWIVVSKNSVVTSRDLRNVFARPSPYNAGVFEVDFSLTPEGAKRLSEASGLHAGDALAVDLDNEVRSAPRMYGRISDRVQITGNFSRESAEGLASALSGLNSRFDCLIIPAQSSQQIFSGLSRDRYPSDVAGGIGSSGVEALKKFVQDGGTLITLNEASQFAIDKLGVPVKNTLEGVPPKDFYCPGSILKIKVDPSSPLTRKAPMLGSSRDESIAWVEGALAFETMSADAKVIARFADSNDILLSGWLLGGEKLANKAAIVEVKMGRGRVIMFAFRPQYRGQSIATLPFLFNAIETSVSQ